MAGAVELADGHVFSDETRDALIEAIPPDSASAIALVEHVWAKPLKAAIARAGGMEIDNDWLKLDELVAVGLRRTLSFGDDDSDDENFEDDGDRT
jgi:hypothetical protein